MAFAILGNPSPQFVDSSGSPYASGTLAILDPADDTNKASYPTYDDAEAATNANSNPITLDARGSCNLWGLDNEDYKLVLKDASGATVNTDDDINLSIKGQFYATTSAEDTAAVTIVNSAIEPGNVLRYGTNTTPGTTDMTVAIQAAINVISQTGGTAYVPAGRYLYSTLYLYYDSANNAGFNSTASKAGRVTIRGDGMMNNVNFVVSSFHGTSLESNITTGNSVILAAPSGGDTSKTGLLHIKDMSFRAATSGYVLQLDEFQQESSLKRVEVRNTHANGGGITTSSHWESFWQDVTIIGAGYQFKRLPASYSTGTGFYIGVIGGDLARFDHVVVRGFNVGFDITETNNNSIFERCVAITNNYGFDVGATNRLNTFIDCHCELNTYRNFRTKGAVTGLNVVGGWWSNVTEEWHASTAYDTAQNSMVENGGNFYTCTTAGTSAGSGGPTGTGTGISDGTCVWDFESAEAISTYANVEFHADTIKPNWSGGKVGVASGTSGFLFVEDNTISPVINDVWFESAKVTMTNSVGINANGSSTGGAGRSERCRFDSPIDTDIDTPEAFLYWTDRNNKKNVRVRDIAAASGLVSISQDDVIQVSGNTQTITGLAASEGQGREVTVIWTGTGIDLTHNATSFKLAGGEDVTGAQGTWRFTTVDGTNWREVSRSVDTAVPDYTLNATAVLDRTLLASASATTLNNNNVLAALITDLQARNVIK